MTHRRASMCLAVAASLAVVLSACGAGETSGIVSGPTSSTPPTASEPPGGWIGGEPRWQDVDREGESTAAASGDGAGAPIAVESAAEDRAGGDIVASTPPRSQALNAGSVDDNERFADYLAYRERATALGIPARPFDPSGRIVAQVVGADGLPIDGVTVTVTAAGADAPTAVLRTDARGSARFFPALAGAASDAYSVRAGDVEQVAAPGETVRLDLATSGEVGEGIAVDVMFVLDATGSMGDEIGQLRSTMIDVAERLGSLDVRPDIRFAMTVYRDEGDTFVTLTYDFTGDVDAFVAALAAVTAEGGGDTPEALDEALAAALGEPAWRDPATTVQLAFLVADAAPHVERQLERPYTASIADAAARGITMHAIAASSTDDAAEFVFREIALGTGGKFVFLTYGADGAALGSSTDIDALDYEELPLGDLVVRLVTEALAGLTGGDVTPPPTSTVPPTNPPGQ